MTELVTETKELPHYQLRAKDIVVGIWITLLLLLSLDSAIFKWLPNYITGARYPLICFLMLVPSRSSYKITRIPELLVLFFSTVFVSVQLGVSYFARETPFIPPETYDDAIYRILANMIFISLIIPWLWLAYRRIESRNLQLAIIISAAIVYPIAILAQLESEWADFFYLFVIAFMSFWSIISMLQVKLLYNSPKNKIGRLLIIIAFLCFGLSFIILAFNRTSITLVLAQLGVDLWIYISYILIALFSESFIFSKHQTLIAVHTYSQVKAKEVSECIVFANIDGYLRNIPEDLVRSIDDEDLTLTWIGLQRTTA